MDEAQQIIPVIIYLLIRLPYIIIFLAIMWRLVYEFILCVMKTEVKFSWSHIFHIFIFSTIIVNGCLPLPIDFSSNIPDIAVVHFLTVLPIKILESYFTSVLLISLIYVYVSIYSENNKSPIIAGLVLVLMSLVFLFTFMGFVGEHYLSSVPKYVLKFAFFTPYAMDILVMLAFCVALFSLLIVAKRNDWMNKEKEPLNSRGSIGELKSTPFTKRQYIWMGLLLGNGCLLLLQRIGVFVIVYVVSTIPLGISQEKLAFILPFTFLNSFGHFLVFLFYLNVVLSTENVGKTEKY
jgi:hypothetical protein